jgi:hypothetical protein
MVFILFYFWSVENVTPNYNIAPMGKCDSHYDASLYELSPVTAGTAGTRQCCHY